jgi:hypothetical protein
MVYLIEPSYKKGSVYKLQKAHKKASFIIWADKKWLKACELNFLYVTEFLDAPFQS